MLASDRKSAPTPITRFMLHISRVKRHPNNDHTTLFHAITTPYGMVTQKSHYPSIALDTRSHCGPIFIKVLDSIGFLALAFQCPNER